MVQYPLPVEHYTPTLRQTPSYVTAPRYRSPTRVVVALLLVTTMLWGCAGQEPLYPDATVLPSRGASQDSTAGVVTGPAQDKDARPGALGEGERSAEIDLYQGALLLSQGMIQEAWHLWATVAKGSHGSAKSVQVDTAWRLLFESYFKHGNPDNTPRFLQEITLIQATANQNHLLQELLSQQSSARLRALLQMQPSTSILLPLFQSALASQPLFGQSDGMAFLGGIADSFLGNSTAASGSALKVGLLLPLSGNSTRMGEHLWRAAKKALADYSNISMQLLMADSGDSAESVRQGIHELLVQEVDVVVGPVFYATVQPAVEIAVAHEIPIITLNPQREADPSIPGVFSNALQPEQQAKIMARYAVLDQQYSRIAVLAPESEYGRGVAKTFGDEVYAQGGSLQRIDYFPSDTTDFSPWLKSMGSRFDALFLPATARQVRLIAPQVAYFQADGSEVALLGTALWNSTELLSSGTDYLQGAVFCDIDTVTKEQFRQSFRQTWEEDPTPLATLAYDGVAVIAQLLQAQQQGGPEWRDGLTRGHGFRGAVGPVRFLDNGRSRRLYYLFQVSKGHIQRLHPFPNSLNIP